jgi:hypothetical protein
MDDYSCNSDISELVVPEAKLRARRYFTFLWTANTVQATSQTN